MLKAYHLQTVKLGFCGSHFNMEQKPFLKALIHCFLCFAENFMWALIWKWSIILSYIVPVSHIISVAIWLFIHAICCFVCHENDVQTEKQDMIIFSKAILGNKHKSPDRTYRLCHLSDWWLGFVLSAANSLKDKHGAHMLFSVQLSLYWLSHAS